MARLLWWRKPNPEPEPEPEPEPVPRQDDTQLRFDDTTP